MKQYFRVMLGKKSLHAEECLKGDFIGVDFGINQDLTGRLPDGWRAFNREFIPIYLANRPEKSKIAAGLACGTLWTVARGMVPAIWSCALTERGSTESEIFVVNTATSPAESYRTADPFVGRTSRWLAIT